MDFTKLQSLLDAAKKETDEVSGAITISDAAIEELDAAKADVTLKQKAVDEAVSEVAKQRGEAVEALRDLVTSIETVISTLSGTSG